MMDDNQLGRVSIWSVLAKYWNSFVWVLIAFLIIWTSVFVAAYDFAEVVNDISDTGSSPFRSGSGAVVALVFVKAYATYTIGAMMILVIVLALLMDGMENLKMTLTRWLREKVEEEQRAKARAEGLSEGREEGRVEGKAQGLSEANRRWTDWYRRLKEAEEKNEPFDEPPPEL